VRGRHKLHGHVPYNQHAGSLPTYKSSFLVSTSQVSYSWHQAVASSHLGGRPSWVVSHGKHGPSRASIVWPSHTYGILASPSRNEGAHTLFSFKELHKSFCWPYWSQYHCLGGGKADLLLHAGQLLGPACYPHSPSSRIPPHVIHLS
jgi:hypothetical protein